MNPKLSMAVITVLLSVTQVFAQMPRPPESIRVPVMAFDKPLSNKAVSLDEDLLPRDFKINDFTVSLGKTKLSEIKSLFKTGIPLYDGTGYYLCYSLPKYSHQLWFVTQGVEFNEKITEMVIKSGDALPTDYCPLITAQFYPMFTNKIGLEVNPELLETMFGKPFFNKRTTAVYLFQLPQSEKLKLQISKGKKGIEMIKVTQQKK